MARRWYHEVSAEWLKARQAVLTATDVASLMPEYKRYLKAGSPDKPTSGFSALWCKKNSVGLIDTSSVEAAARGHIMEPYAVDAWNRQMRSQFHHWDDCIICDSTGHFGFSPDAMTIPQLGNSVKIQADGSSLISGDGIKYDQPSSIMEIKCYEPTKHMKAIMQERMEHDELMQLAMAFVVLPQLETAWLVWYCPGAPFEMYAQQYTRDDLHDQIRWILEIGEVYLKAENYWKQNAPTGGYFLNAMHTEEEVYLDYLADQGKDNIFILK